MGDVIPFVRDRLSPPEAFEQMDVSLTRAAVLLAMVNSAHANPDEIVEQFGDEVKKAIDAWADLTLSDWAMDRIRACLAPQTEGAA